MRRNSGRNTKTKTLSLPEGLPLPWELQRMCGHPPGTPGACPQLYAADSQPEDQTAVRIDGTHDCKGNRRPKIKLVSEPQDGCPLKRGALFWKGHAHLEEKEFQRSILRNLWIGLRCFLLIGGDIAPHTEMRPCLLAERFTGGKFLLGGSIVHHRHIDLRHILYHVFCEG